MLLRKDGEIDKRYPTNEDLYRYKKAVTDYNEFIADYQVAVKSTKSVVRLSFDWYCRGCKKIVKMPLRSDRKPYICKQCGFTMSIK